MLQRGASYFSVLQYCAQIQRKIIRWRPQQRQPTAGSLNIIDVVLMTTQRIKEIEILNIARLVARKCTCTHREGFSERQVDNSAQVTTQVIPMGHAGGADLQATAGGLGRRIDGDISDQATDAAGAIERSLGTAQYFDLRQIVR